MSSPQIAAKYCHRVSWADVDPCALDTLISQAKAEDLNGWGLANPGNPVPDPGEAIVNASPGHAQAAIVARTPLVVAGLPLVAAVLRAYDSDLVLTEQVPEGHLSHENEVLARVSGPADALLRAERVFLNFLQRLSGIASLTRTYVDALGTSETRLLDTRKTTPGFRVLEKYAVACGGGWNHRMGLFDRVMLKDNHLAAAKARSGRALRDFLAKCRQDWADIPLQVEVDSPEQIQPALDAGIDLLLLDNFSTAQLEQAVSQTRDCCAIEASGTITLQRLPELAPLGLDFISTGATIHQATWKDIGLDWI